VSTRTKAIHSLTFLTAVAALVVAIIALATPGPQGPAGPQGVIGPVGATGEQGPRGQAADTSAMASRIATLERQLELVDQAQQSEGIASPSYEADVPSYEGDLDCSDYAETDFATPPGDPNGLDGDGDGIACES
jgi:hypothetical protein